MVVILLFLLSPLLVGVVEAKDRFLLEGCSSRCTLAFDEDLSCWNKTAQFFGEALVGVMLRYVITQVNILTVEKKRYGKETSVDEIIQESVQRMKQQMDDWDLDNAADILSTETIRETVTALVNNSFEAVRAGQYPALLPCPEGCEKSPKLWHSWTLGLLVVAGVLTTVMCIITFNNDRKDNKYALTDNPS